MARKKITDGLRQKPNGVWERAETINGKRRWFSSRDPEEVWKKRNQALAEAEKSEEERGTGPLFSIVADAYQERVERMKAGTQKSYLPAIKRAKERFGGMHMREIEPYMIAQFLQSLSEMAQTTVSNQKTIINAIFQLWIDSPEWKGDVNPAAITKIPRGLKKGKRLPPTEAQVQVVKDYHMDPDALPAVVYLCTGERRGEACAIQLQDIDFKGSKIYIKKSVEHIHNQPHITTTKTESGIREIPLLSLLREALEPLRFMPPETYILSGKDTPLTASQYTRRWAAFWRKHGYAHPVVREYRRTRNGKQYTYHQTDWVADVCAHQFRHEYVCMLCMAEVPEEIAIQLVGHANAKMIHEVYMSLKPQMVQMAGDRLDALLKAN